MFNPSELSQGPKVVQVGSKQGSVFLVTECIYMEQKRTESKHQALQHGGLRGKQEIIFKK